MNSGGIANQLRWQRMREAAKEGRFDDIPITDRIKHNAFIKRTHRKEQRKQHALLERACVNRLAAKEADKRRELSLPPPFISVPPPPDYPPPLELLTQEARDYITSCRRRAATHPEEGPEEVIEFTQAERTAWFEDFCDASQLSDD